MAVTRQLTTEHADRLLAIALGVKMERLWEQGIANPKERLEIIRRWINDVLFEMEEGSGNL